MFAGSRRATAQVGPTLGVALALIDGIYAGSFTSSEDASVGAFPPSLRKRTRFRRRTLRLRTVCGPS